MSELAAIDFGYRPELTAAEIVDRLRAAEIEDHVDSIREILGEDLGCFEADAELRESVRQIAHQRYVSARDDRQNLLGRLSQAEERLSTESRIFSVVERLTCSPR